MISMKGLQSSVLHIILMGVVLLLLSGSLLNARVAPPKLPLNESTGLPGSPVNLSFVSQPDALFADFQYRSSDDRFTCQENGGNWRDGQCNYRGLPMPVEVCFAGTCLFNSRFYKVAQLNILTGQSYRFVLIEAGLTNTAQGISVFQFGVFGNEAKTSVLQAAGGGNMNENAIGVQLAGIFNNNKDRSYGISAAGLVNFAGDVKGMQLTAGLNVAGRVQGAQVALFGNMADESAFGIQTAGLVNKVRGRLDGVQAAVLVNSVEGDVAGLQVSGLVNESAGSLTGVQLAAGGNGVDARLVGLQGAVLANYAGEMQGVQVGIANKAHWRMKGAQIGVLNVANDQGAEKGAQIGLWNSAEKKCLVQLGVINSCNGRARFQFGLLNMAKDNWIPITILVNFDFN